MVTTVDSAAAVPFPGLNLGQLCCLMPGVEMVFQLHIYLGSQLPSASSLLPINLDFNGLVLWDIKLRAGLWSVCF